LCCIHDLCGERRFSSARTTYQFDLHVVGFLLTR
jgi:hypothetical protein